MIIYQVSSFIFNSLYIYNYIIIFILEKNKKIIYLKFRIPWRYGGNFFTYIINSFVYNLECLFQIIYIYFLYFILYNINIY